MQSLALRVWCLLRYRARYLPDECGYGNGSIHGDRFAKRFDAFDFMHGLRGEIGSPAVWAGPHGNIFNDQQAGTMAKTTGDFP